MKILMCNTFNYMRGGAERCFIGLNQILRENGHEVVPFCMNHQRNEPSPYEKYFVSEIDFPSQLSKDAGLVGKLRIMERVIYSREARQKIEQMIEDTQPDIVHIHGIAHEISPSILPGIKKYNLPIVQTLHDYKLLCPNTSFVSQNEVCERCKGHKYYNAALRRCKRDSLSASMLASVEMYAHKISQIYERHVDYFIAPSLFLKEKVEEYGIKNPVAHIPNFIDIDEFNPDYEPDGYFVYFGRLVSIKGIHTLIEAMKQVGKSRLLVAGSGDVETALRDYCRHNGIHNVEFLGYLRTEQIVPLLQKAAFVVMPSEWYENYSMAVLEAFACGTPVIGARIGGIPEQVLDHETGLLFEPGNVGELAQKLNFMLDNPDVAIEMGRQARRFVEKNNHPDVHLAQTLNLYNRLLPSKVSV